MTDELREELQGFAEAWRDDACRHREPSDPTSDAVAATYDECADEIEAMLARLAAHPADGEITTEFRRAADIEAATPITAGLALAQADKLQAAAWRPIETAPRDGTWFAIFTGWEFEVGRYDPSTYDRYVEIEGGLYRKEKEVGYE